MNKRGTTLIETVISIFLISVVVVTLLEGLNVGMTGTLNLSRKTSALNLAKSQMEWVKNEAYNGSAGNLSDVYGVITTVTSNISDQINYNISGTITNVSTNQSLQEIAITVNYIAGKQVQLTGYKAARESLSEPPAKGMVVSDVIEDMPFEAPGGWSLGCWDLWEWLTGDEGCGTWTGYYHVFQTSEEAYISATWGFNWTNEFYDNVVFGLFTWGAPMIGIYEGVPDWVQRDYQGDVQEDGVIFRGGTDSLSGCMPGCDCDPTTTNESKEAAELIIMEPPSCSTDMGNDNWVYEHDFDVILPPYEWWSLGHFWTNEYFEFTLITEDPVPEGTYTVLFFNGEDRISFETVTASVTYVY